MNWFWKCFYGTLHYQITGKQSLRFVRLCQRKGILLLDLVKRDNDSYEGSIPWSQSKIFVQLANKCEVSLRKLEDGGFLYELWKRKQYIYIFLFLPLIWSGYDWFSSRIWQIEVAGNVQLSKEEITDYLGTISCGVGSKKSEILTNGIELQLREQFPEIIWASAQMKGSGLLLTIKEDAFGMLAKDPEAQSLVVQKLDINAPNMQELEWKEPVAREQAPRTYTAISLEKGRVLALFLRQGTALCAPGDEIIAGDALVTGQVPIYDTLGEEIIGYTYALPDFDIQIETYLEYQAFAPFLKRVRYPYQVVPLAPSLLFGKWRLGPEFLEDANGNARVQKFSQCYLIGEYPLPIYKVSNSYVTFEDYGIFLDKSTVSENLKQEYNLYREQLERNGISVLEEEVSFYVASDGMLLRSQLLVHKLGSYTIP